MNHPRILLTALMATSLLGLTGQTWAQKSYDDREMEDRFYVRLGGFRQNEIRTTLRLDAKSPGGGVGAGAIVVLESAFDVENSVTNVRLDGWWRFSKKNRINWSYWRSTRDGMRVYQGDPIDIGDITINPGDGTRTKSKNTVFAVFYTYSFLNTSKYEAWLGGGFNVQSVDYTIQGSASGGTFDKQERARGTVPIPTLNLGGRWNFSKNWRALVQFQLFGLDIGDYSGRLNNSTFFVEYNFVRHFGLGFGLDRYNFEVNAETDDFFGELDVSYTGVSAYLKGQF